MELLRPVPLDGRPVPLDGRPVPLDGLVPWDGRPVRHWMVWSHGRVKDAASRAFLPLHR